MTEKKLSARIDTETEKLVLKHRGSFDSMTDMVKEAFKALEREKSGDKTTEKKPFKLEIKHISEIGTTVTTVAPEGSPPWVAVALEKRKRPDTYPHKRHVDLWERLLLPVGDLLNSVNGPYVRLWPVGMHHKAEIERLFEPWRKAGFVAVWGPVNTEICVCPSTRMQAYFPGDRKVWCDFPGKDAAAALEFLVEHPEVILPMIPDLDRFNDDIAYQTLYNSYHRYYSAYFSTGKPFSDEEA